MIQEDNYIIELLKAFILEWKTSDEFPENIINKYALILTAYMNGRLREVKKT